MILDGLPAFLALAAVGAYVQTLTGFAFGLMVMGGVGLTGALPLPQAAIAVSLLVLVNASQVLARGWRHIARRELALTLAGSLPMIPAGYALMSWLAGARLAALQLLLGVVIVGSAIRLARPGGRRTTRSPDASFFGFGTVAGVMGGLFSTAGPPVIYHFYRQPFAHATIRETLVAIFAANATLRLCVVASQGQLSGAPLVAAALGAPVVAAATYAARRWPPPLPQPAIRGAAFAFLALSGLALAGPALMALTAPPA